MISLIVRLALSHVYSASHEKNISLMVKLCFIALMISAFALTLVVGIMNGFQKETSKKLQGIHADVIIKTSKGILDYEKITAVLEKEFPLHIQAYAPQALHNILLRSPAHDILSPLCVCIGIDPLQEKNVTTLFSTIISPVDTSYNLTQHTILLGATAARALGVTINSPIDLLYIADQPHRKKITLEETKSSISGIFRTGIDEFDTAVVYCNLALFKKIFKTDEISHIIIKCNPDIGTEQCARALKNRFKNLEIYTWKDLYPALVSALALEKYAAFIVLTLCALIAAINCMALIFMYITQKKMEIVILKTLGMRNKDISKIFVLIGFFITLFATVLGIAFACIAGFFLERYPLITLPDAYYVDHLPVLIDVPLVLSVFFTMLFLGLVASYIPARRIHTFSVAHLLKFGAE